MTTATGVVKGIYNKDVKTRFGIKKVYDLLLDDGNYYKQGFKKPICDVGDSVTIEYNVGQYGNDITSLIRGTSSGASAPSLNDGSGFTKPNASPNQYSNKGNKPFPVPSDHGDRSIIRQNSLTNAREMCIANNIMHKNLVDNNVLANEIIRVAYMFEEYSSGDREVKAVDALMESNKATKVSKPKKVKVADPSEPEEDYSV